MFLHFFFISLIVISLHRICYNLAKSHALFFYSPSRSFASLSLNEIDKSLLIIAFVIFKRFQFHAIIYSSVYDTVMHLLLFTSLKVFFALSSALRLLAATQWKMWQRKQKKIPFNFIPMLTRHFQQFDSVLHIFNTMYVLHIPFDVIFFSRGIECGFGLAFCAAIFTWNSRYTHR